MRFNLTPQQLFETAIRPRGRHVLLVIEDRLLSPLEHARKAAGVSADSWIVASAGSAAADLASSDLDGQALQSDHLNINLRRQPQHVYEPVAIAASLDQELRNLDGVLSERNVGFLFADTSQVMCRQPDPAVVRRFEHQWADLVSDAAARVGARASWNVCVYELDDLRGLDDPLAATADLMRSHDTIWAARRGTLSAGTAGRGES